MTEKQRKKIVYIGFVLAVIFGLYHFAGDFNKSQTVTPTPEQEIAVTSVLPPAQSINIGEYSALEWGPDPFYRGSKTKIRQKRAKTPQWTLKGILYDEKDPTAIINGKVVRSGDIVAGARVIAIGKKSVSIEFNGSRLELSVTRGKS